MLQQTHSRLHLCESGSDIHTFVRLSLLDAPLNSADSGIGLLLAYAAGRLAVVVTSGSEVVLASGGSIVAAASERCAAGVGGDAAGEFGARNHGGERA